MIIVKIREHVAAAAVGIALSTTLFFVLLVGWQTVFDYPVPLKFAESTARAYANGDDTILVYRRPITASSAVSFILERSISCEHSDGVYVYDLPPMSRYIEGPGTVAPDRVIVFPLPLPIGSVCQLESTVKWWPIFGMSARTSNLPPIRFEVGAK